MWAQSFQDLDSFAGGSENRRMNDADTNERSGLGALFYTHTHTTNDVYICILYIYM